MICQIKQKFNIIKECIFVFLLAIWFMIPILKEFQITCIYTLIYEYDFILTVGIIGLLFLLSDIIIKFRKSENKKEYCKEILPIIVLTIFMGWTLISTIFAENQRYAYWGTNYRKDGYFTYLAYAGFFSCAFLMKSKFNKIILLNLFVIVAALNIIMVELYNNGILTQLLMQRKTDTTCFSQFNHYGYYLLLATTTSIFLFITQKNKIIKVLYLLLYAFLLYFLILNNTLGCQLALLITLILFMIYCIYHKQNKILSIITIIIFLVMLFINQDTRVRTFNNIKGINKDINNIISAFMVNDTKIEEKEKIIKKLEKVGTNRLGLWKSGIEFILERPILGYGPENVGRRYYKLGHDNDRPHNLLIQLAITSGIPGLITYMTAIGIILIRALKTLNKENSILLITYSCVIAYLISAMFGNSMYYTSPYFFIFLGFVMYENINVLKDKKENKE